jgi:hypothetical protein
MKRMLRIAAVVLLTSLTSVAFAVPRGKPSKVIELEEMIIEGKVAKPQVFYVLGRSTIRYEGLRLDQSFVTRIVATVRKNPF